MNLINNSLILALSATLFSAAGQAAVVNSLNIYDNSVTQSDSIRRYVQFGGRRTLENGVSVEECDGIASGSNSQNNDLGQSSSRSFNTSTGNVGAYAHASTRENRPDWPSQYGFISSTGNATSYLSVTVASDTLAPGTEIMGTISYSQHGYLSSVSRGLTGSQREVTRASANFGFNLWSANPNTTPSLELNSSVVAQYSATALARDSGLLYAESQNGALGPGGSFTPFTVEQSFTSRTIPGVALLGNVQVTSGELDLTANVKVPLIVGETYYFWHSLSASASVNDDQVPGTSTSYAEADFTNTGTARFSSSNPAISLNVAPIGTTVPEPSSACLSLLSLALLTRRSRLTRSNYDRKLK